MRIETIYSDNNSGSHFNPLTDSIKIYAVIFRFMLSSAACSIIDIGLFTLVNMLCAPLFGKNNELRIFAATAFARIISSFTNFMLNRRRVFRSGTDIKRSAVRYYILAAGQLAASTLIVSGVSFLLGAGADLWQTVIKLVADTVLFFISFGNCFCMVCSCNHCKFRMKCMQFFCNGTADESESDKAYFLK